ncbi:MAG: hypothetical protein ACIAXF_16040 [Phycisphaerales bacterium JB063]
MRVAPRANLTITLLRHQSFGTDRLIGVGPQSPAALPLAVPVERSVRTDIVELSPQCAKPELSNTQHAACSCPAVPVAQPSPLPNRAAEETHSKKDDVPPPPRPNPEYEPTDSGGIGLLDLLA